MNSPSAQRFSHYSPEEQFRMHRLKRIQDLYGCSFETADTYLSLLEEGYSKHQAALMAGISDPSSPE